MPQEQVFRGLLGDGGDAPRLADVGILQPLADFPPVDAAVTAEAPVPDAMTVTGKAGAMRSSGTKLCSTRAPVAQRQSIGVETGLTTR